MLVSTVTAITSGFARSSRARGLGRGLRGRLHHRHTARGVDVDHPRTRGDRRLDRLRDGVRDVVKLQIEEDARRPGPTRRRTSAGPFEREETAADFDAVHDAVQRRGELDRAGARFDVERD